MLCIGGIEFGLRNNDNDRSLAHNAVYVEKSPVSDQKVVYVFHIGKSPILDQKAAHIPPIPSKKGKLL